MVHSPRSIRPAPGISQPTGITPAGAVVGAYCDAPTCSFPTANKGFLRTPNGTFTTFSPPTGSSIFPAIYNPGGPPPGINPAGEIAGSYVVSNPSFTEHGFLRAPNGTFTTFDPPGSIFTEITAINSAGVIIGDYNNGAAGHAFLRIPDGTVTTFDQPPFKGDTLAFAINPAGVIAGGGDGGPFLRYPDGTFTTYEIAGAFFVSPQSINPAGAVAGLFADPSGLKVS